MRKIKVLFPEVEAGLGHIMPLRSVYEVFNKKYGDKVDVIKLNYFKNTGYKKLEKFGEMLVNEVKAYSNNHFRGYFATKACEFFGTTLSTVGTMIIKIPGSHIEGIKYMEDINPDVVFSTHWATNYYAENMKNKPFTIMYCPDVIMNKLFMYHADLTLLSMKPGYDLAKRYKKYNDENLRLVPFLIRNEAYDIPTNKLSNRKQLNLPEDKFTITIAEGGYGIGRLKELCEKLTKEHLPLTIIAVCGKNEELKEYLSALEVSKEVTFIPLGFTDKMLEYIASSDLFLGKSGNIISEPTFFGIPSIITGFATTIERNIGNYYINNVRSSIKEFDVDNIIRLIKEFINNPKLLEPYKNNAIAYHSNYGSEYTADLIWEKIVERFPELLKEGVTQ